MPIVLCPSRRKCLRNIMDCGFICLILGMKGAPDDKKRHEQVAANSKSALSEEAR